MKFIPDGAIYIDVDDTLIIDDSPNLPLIDLMKRWKSEKRPIIVWTSNFQGVNWAIDKVKLLGIEDLVDICLPKPNMIVDDDTLEYYSTIDPKTLEWRKR